MNSCVSNKVYALLLCVSTAALFGFSTSDSSQVKDDSSLQVQVIQKPEPNRASLRSSDATLSTVQVPSVLNHFQIRRRPSSYATDFAISHTLMPIDSDLWLPSGSTLKSRASSAAWLTAIGGFRNVGFPDIRTYKKAASSPFDAPGPWAPLVVWRDLQGSDSAIQPIASVRCMGLSPRAVAKRADRFKDTIYSLARRYEVNPQLIKAVITEESCFDDQALSSVGAQGLMQLMPETASWLKVNDPLDAQQNLKGGVRYLASLQKQFDSMDLVLAAYNAGPGNVRRYEGIPPFAETQGYVQKVQANYRRYMAAHRLLFPPQEPLAEVKATSYAPQQ